MHRNPEMALKLLRVFTAGLVLAGSCGQGFAQPAPPLRGSLDDVEAPVLPEDAAPPVTSTPLRDTTLEITPAEPVEVPRRAEAEDADPYAPTGIGTGALRLYPSLTVGTVFTSNVNESASDPKPDTGLLLRPRLRLESDWVRHAYEADIDGDLIHYRENGQSDTRNVTAEQSLRLDVRRFTTATFDTRYTLETPEDGDPEEQTLNGGVTLRHDFGPVVTTLRGGLLGKTFGDTKLAGGGVEDNDDLDYAEPSVSLRNSFRVSDMLRPYVEARYAPRLYGETPDRNGFDRLSDGYQFSAGIEVAEGPLWSGELGLTYLHRNYRDGDLQDTSAIGLTGELTWSPSELTAIVLSAETQIDEVVSSTEAGTPVYNFRADLTHALRDNIDLLAGAGLEIEDAADQTDRTYDASLGIAWAFNPVVSWTAAYDFSWLDSSTRNEDYTEHRVTTGLTISR